MKRVALASCLLLVLIGCSKEQKEDAMPPTDTNPRFEIIEIETSFGQMHIWLHSATQRHRANFIQLADSGFYNNTTFHRIIPGFMIQGGDPNSKDSDPNNDGQGGPGYTIPAEILDTFKNERGTLAAARLGNVVNPTKASSGSQFYINIVNNTHLDGEYTVFGKVIKGIEVADSIVIQPRNINNRPFTDIRMQVRVLRLTKDEIYARFTFNVPNG